MLRDYDNLTDHPLAMYNYEIPDRTSATSLFAAGQTVRGMRVLDFLDWARKSDEWLAEVSPTPPDNGVLALPPVQRSPVWRPKQVLDLWDSALRGLPLGALFLVPRSNETAHGMGADADNKYDVGAGWNLLDGQQRTRSLLLGLRGPELTPGLQDKRCIWIDLTGKHQSHRFSLHLTSESQPFGYQSENGEKLPVDDRRKARNAIETEIDPIRTTEGRPAFNHELFGGFINETLTPTKAPVGWQSKWPPLPARAITSTAVFPLHVLLEAWRRGKTGEERLRRLREAVPASEQVERAIAQLHKAFEELRSAEFALVKVKLDDKSDNLLLLFDRIGAGGSRLTNEERLFSIYKHREHRVHDAVNRIYYNKRVGRVLPPTNIAASAIRIANARSHQEPGEGNFLPDVKTFAEEMADGNPRIKRTESIRSALRKLLPMHQNEGSLATAFDMLFAALKYNDRAKEDIGLPRLMFTRLSANLLQVLLLWVLQSQSADVLRACRSDVIRFVMFWRLCVLNENKASGRCFEAIRKNTGITMKALYDLLVSDDREVVAVRLASPQAMRACLASPKGAFVWRALADRFDPKGEGPVVLAKQWWNSGEASLLWLQRGYLARTFRDFDPASGRDDDTPYDIDHMIPRSDWNEHWSTFSKKLKATGLFGGDGDAEGPQLRQMKWNRGIGDAIGNRWLVDFSINRKWGKKPFSEKIGCLIDEEKRQCASELSYRDMAFDRDAAQIWKGASGIDGTWSRERLIGFQQALEERAAWLYERFYADLGFVEWTGDCCSPS